MVKCKFEHGGYCCNRGSMEYMDKCKKPCDTIEPITNADHIRAMSDKELATSDLLSCPYIKDLHDEIKFGWCMREQTCEECILEWLLQPADMKKRGQRMKKCVCGCEMTKHDWKNQWVCHRCGRTKSIEVFTTNADRIRAMSDEELGLFLAEWAEKPWAWKRDGEGECLVWLQEPVKGGEVK